MAVIYQCCNPLFIPKSLHTIYRNLVHFSDHSLNAPSAKKPCYVEYCVFDEYTLLDLQHKRSVYMCNLEKRILSPKSIANELLWCYLPKVLIACISWAYSSLLFQHSSTEIHYATVM